MERVRRRWWTALVTLGALMVVTGALLTAAFQLVMLMAPGYRADLADYVSRVAGQPVEIGGVGLGWSGLAPRLDLTDITLYGADELTPALSAQRLRLGFGLLRLARGDTTPQRVELSGLELFAQIDKDGAFSLRGLDTSGMPSRATQDWLRQLGRFQRVRLSDCELQLDDARLRGPEPRFRLVDAELRFSDGRGKATAELALPPGMGSSVKFRANIHGDLERPDTWNGRWKASVEELRGLPWLDAQLAEGAAIGFSETELSVDGVLERGKVGAVDIRLEATGLVGRNGADRTTLRDINLDAHLTPQAEGWTLDITQLRLSGAQGPWPETRARIQLTRQAQGPPSLDLVAAHLRLADLMPWLVLLPDRALVGSSERLRNVSGEVRGLVLRWTPGDADTGARYSLRADLDGLALESSPSLPGFEGLSGEFSASENGGRLLLRETPFGLRYAKVFGRTLSFESIAGELAWTRTGEGWDVQMPRFGWQLDGSRGEGSLALLVPNQTGVSPRMKLDARFSATDVTRFKAYMPVFWPESLRSWLGRAIEAGRAPAARLRIEGELADFPFVNKPGLFALDIDAADARLAFAPDWPAVEKLAAHLEFRGNSLAIRGESGTVSGNRVEKVEALIEDLHVGQLRIRGEAQGDAARFYDFLRASPLAAKLSGLLTRTTASGDAVVHVDLDIPLHSARDTQVRGRANLRSVRLQINGVPEPAVDIRGDLAFDNHGASAEALTARLYDTAIRASLRTEPDGVLRLRGGFEFVPDALGTGLSQVLPGFLRAPMLGSSQWSAVLPLTGPESGRLRLSSDLQGLALLLPKPMDKPAEAAWPIQLDFGSDKTFPLRLALEMPDRLGADLAFARTDEDHLRLQRARLRAGSGPAPHADEDSLFIVGTAADLEPLRWVATVLAPAPGASAAAPTAASTSPTPSPALNADLNVGRLWLGGQMVEGVRLTQSPAAGGWIARLSGNGAQGELSFREDADHGLLTGRFVRAQINSRLNAAEAAAEKQRDKVHGDPTDPGRLPRLDLLVDNLRIGSAELGRLEFRSARIADGQRIEQLRSSGGGTTVEAQGEWRRVQGRSSGALQFVVDSNAIADLLKGLGYAANLGAKRSHFSGALNWPALAATAAQGLELARGEGHLEVDIDKGALRAVEPGAGRVLGLINFWALPRRLSLDFRDVLSEGLGFDQIKGRFVLADGTATTDNLDVKAPSLKMEVRGKVGLVAHDYDQRVRVYPDMSSGITLGALLIGGPIAGVLTLLAQEVLEQPLDQVGQLSYRLTGSWDDPQVVRESGLRPGGGQRAVVAPAPATVPAAPSPPGPAPVATTPTDSNP